MCYAFHRAERQIRAVYIGKDDDWTEVLDWANQERAQLDAIAKEAEKEEKMSDLDKKQTGDLVFRLAFTPEAEINEIMDTGMFNEIVKGYLVIAMRDIGEDKDAIDKAVCALEAAFDSTDAAAARKAYRDEDARSNGV